MLVPLVVQLSVVRPRAGECSKKRLTRCLLTSPPLCRAQLAYSRYWEGRTQLQIFASKLTDVTVQALCFDAYTIPEISTLQEQAYDKFKDNLIHLISLLHAVAIATLREDYNMENITVRSRMMHDTLHSKPNYRG
jgi:hypothetical protein